MATATNVFGYIFTDAAESRRVVLAQTEVSLPLPMIGEPMDVSKGTETIGGVVQQIRQHLSITETPAITIRQIEYTIIFG